MGRLKELTIEGIRHRLDGSYEFCYHSAIGQGKITALNIILACFEKRNVSFPLKELTVEALDKAYEYVVRNDDGGYINPVLYHQGFRLIFNEAKDILRKQGD